LKLSISALEDTAKKTERKATAWEKILTKDISEK
jgi:hypothetical protein